MTNSNDFFILTIFFILKFKAIWCNLAGIKPTGSVDVWSEDMIDEIYNEIDEYHEQLYLHTITDNKAIKSLVDDTNIMCYDVALLAIHNNQQINLNKMLIEKGLVDIDPQTANRLENIPSIIEEEEEENWDEYCDEGFRRLENIGKSSTPNESLSPNETDDGFIDNFTEEELIDFIQEIMTKKPVAPKSDQRMITDCIAEEDEEEISLEEKSTDQIASQSAAALHESPKKTDEDVNGSMDNLDDTKMISKTDGHQIEYIYQHPKIYWQQNDEWIVLKISAHDDVKYGLEVTENHLIYK